MREEKRFHLGVALPLDSLASHTSVETLTSPRAKSRALMFAEGPISPGKEIEASFVSRASLQIDANQLDRRLLSRGSLGTVGDPE
jgi:hypothetical protein